MRRILGFVAVLVIASGCNKSVSRPDRGALDSPVEVTLQEELPSHALVFDCRTEREYGCSNYRIDTRLSRSAAGFKIDFRDVIVPGGCLTSLGPARVRLRPGILGTGGVAVQFRTPLGMPAAWLETTGDRYVLVTSPNRAVKIESPQLRRIPDGTIWGFFGYARTDLEPAVNAIRGRIAALGATERALPEGRYQVLLKEYQGDRFRADAAGRIAYDSPTGYVATSTFACQFHGDLAALRELVNDVGRQYGDAIHLRIYTWQGDHLFSWMHPA